MKKFKNLFIYSAILASVALFSCEGPMGPAGAKGDNGIDGIDGIDGVDANQTCKVCHTPTSVDLISQQFEWSKHKTGLAAYEEAGNAACAPCHESEGFKYVIANSTPVTFTIASGGTDYTNNYSATAATAWGDITCSTCHSALHSTYGGADLALTTTAAVPMTMFGGTQTLNLKGSANLCVKCHQPRPVTKNNGASPKGAPITYSDLAVAANLTSNFWSGSSATAGTGNVKPSYRTGGHYGAVGSIYGGVGKGGIEFVGSESYINSQHTTVAECKDCHMAGMGGTGGGGHTFFVKGNLTGCDVTGCHTTTPVSTTGKSAYWTNPRANIKALLDQLAPMLTITHNDGNTYPLLMTNTDSEANLWYGHTTANYDGYINIYGSSSPTATIPNTWFNLTNAQMGAVLNFQLCLREYSLGIHNYKYTHALLHNTIEILGGTPAN
jgi:hypothetical protein